MASYLGIEIGPEAVRGALVRTQLRKAQIVGYLEVPIARPEPVRPLGDVLEQGAAVAPEALDPVQAAVRELLRRAGAPAPTLIAALPGEEASIRRIELPAAAAKKLDELLPFEMEALVPFDAEQTILDHQPIEAAEGKLRVLVATAPKERIRVYLEQLAAVGADPRELAVGAAALDGLAVLVPELASEGPHLVVHLGARRTEVAVLRHGRCELARTIGVGVADLDDAHHGAASVAGPDRLARELKQTLAAWRLQGGATPAAVHLTGLGLHDPRLPAWIERVLDQPAQTLDLPDSTPPSQLPPELRARCGLALALAGRALGRGKRIDLRKGEFVVRRNTGWVRQHAGLLVACSAAIVAAFLFSTYARWSVLAARRQALEEELARISRERLGEETRSPARARALLAGGGVRADPLPRFTAYDALAAISTAIPTEASGEGDIRHDVQRLHIDLGDGRSSGHVELAGTVSTIEQRDRIAQAFGQVECFRGIELGPLTQAPNDRRHYRIEADIQCPGAGGADRASKRRGGRSRAGRGGGDS